MSVPIPPEDLAFELPNGGVGPDPLSLASIDAAFAVLLFHRDYHCRRCGRQARRVADRYEEFDALDAAVVSILPESKEAAADWARQYDLPFPVLADSGSAVADRYGQPVRFGFVGALHDLIGRMPVAAIVDLRVDPQVIYTHIGEAPDDRPGVETLLIELRTAREAGPTRG